MILKSNAQDVTKDDGQAKIKPFSVLMFGVTVTGTYADGCLSSTVVNGTNILWGLISWGGSTQITCTTGCLFCHVTAIISVGRMNVITNDAGDKCFEQVKTPDGSTPVLVGVKDGAVTFAIDIDQTAEHQKRYYENSVFELTSPFILGPELVKGLKLTDSDEEMGYIIPAGKYPIYRDGNIYYWTFESPK